MSRPKLSIGMATHTDFNGVYFTIQTIRMYFRHLLKDIQLVVVDNSPRSEDADMVAKLCGSVRPRMHSVKYISMEFPVGTSPSRERVVQEMDGEVKIVCDGHIEFEPGGIEAVLDYFKSFPESRDILSGPMWHDDIVGYSTHFNDVWDAEMWGKWGAAWMCKCGNSLFTTRQRDGKVECTELKLAPEILSKCPYCRKPYPIFPQLDWGGHEIPLEASGHRRLGGEEDTVPFKIPGMGLGCFAFRAEAWVGFNPDARGFGGEELYLHEKFRVAGGEAVCLPQFKWLHRFGRPGGVPYPLSFFSKVRNYVLEFQEMGWDLEPVYRHFVKDNNKLSEDEWAGLIKDPKKVDSKAKACKPCGSPIVAAVGLSPDKVAGPMPDATTTEAVFKVLVSKPRDLNKHMMQLRGMATGLKHITEFSGRRESLVALAMSKPEKLVSYNSEYRDSHTQQFLRLLQEEQPDLTLQASNETRAESIEETDLLFLDTDHTYERVRDELFRYGPSVRNVIILHDTDIFGINGPNGTRGILYAIAEFVREHKDWDVVHHTKEQYGLTTLGRTPKYKPPLLPSILPSPGYGPGTELKLILASIGITPAEKCDCNARAAMMDVWGVEGSEYRRDAIIAWLREGAPRWGWDKFLAAGLKAVFTGLAFKLNPLDPIPSLVDLAISNAREKGVPKGSGNVDSST